MKKTFFLASVALLLTIAACTRVALTGRQQVNVFKGEGQRANFMQMSFASYKDFMSKAKPMPTSNANTQMVQRIGAKLTRAIETYLIQNGMGKEIDGYQWEFSLVDDKNVNAFCMPGGKVVFYTGILPICKNEDGIAVVMGHEIAHAIANHGAERMTRAYGAQILGQVGAVAVGAKTGSQEAVDAFSQIFGLGATAGVILPNSRNQESEADKLGLIFMRMAGYNVREGAELWKRMSQNSAGGQKPPQWMSTHPSDATRIANMTQWAPEVEAKWQPQR